ncbi:MAG: LysE family translocator [Cyclobacteriaceae bacterium]|nr:LysE family translocator [Cyclobacteriaceae bacterium]
MIFIQVLLVAMLVSFLGSIPPGTINVSVMQLSIQGHRKAALSLGLGAAIMEFMYSGVTVYFQQYLTSNPNLTHYFQFVTATVLVVIGLGNLFSKVTSKSFKSTETVRKRMSFRKGIMLGLLNPLTIPYWLSVTTYLDLNGWIQLDGFNFWMYVSGISLGTFTLMISVDLLGNRFQKVADNPFLVHKVPGIILLSMGLYNFYQLFF